MGRNDFPVPQPFSQQISAILLSGTCHEFPIHKVESIFKRDDWRRHSCSVLVLFVHILFPAFKNRQTHFITVRIDCYIFRRERSQFIGNVNHRSRFRNQIAFYRRTLWLKHIVWIFGLAKSVHHSTVKRIGMITALVVERVPETCSDYLSRHGTYIIIT